MGIFTIFAIAFVIAKCLGYSAWSWWWLPLIFFGDVLLVLGLGTFTVTISVIIKEFFSGKGKPPRTRV